MLGAHIDITEKIAIQLELRRRNQKLLDFAFSNAHHVRGPVARMLGLVHLSKFDTERDQKWYMQTIAGEVEGLDEIIKSIARDLDEIEELQY
jgi:signal transduction histidine kinase